MRKLWIPVLLIAAVVGIAAADSPSPVVYPDQRLPLRFDHAAHATRGAACADCHAAATTSKSAVDNLLPGEAACRTCHTIDRAKPDATCGDCHTGWTADAPPARVYIPPPNLKFSHAAHAARDLACTGCHDVATAALATRDHLPSMETCTDCHDGVKANGDCTLCHLAEIGVVKTTFANGRLVPENHGIDFERNHATLATSAGADCGSCHRERDCSDCHTGVTRPEDFHPSDYVQVHAADARRNVPDCSTCHREQTFCVGCHERSGIGTRDTDFDQDTATTRFHPADWVPDRHAREARANLEACTSCHREDDCLACHTAEPGSPQVSPHGPGWRNSRKCEALVAKNPRMCLRCHIDEASCDL